MVHHRRGAHQPGIRLAGLGVPAPLGPEDGGLLLRLADEEDPFAASKACQVLGGDIVLALPLGEGQDLDALLGGEGFDGLDEGVADGRQQGGGGEEVAAVVAQEADHAQFPLQLRDVDVEVHAVDALDFQSHVLAQDSCDGAR